MQCVCIECGAQFDNGKNRVQRFCSPEPGRNMSLCATRHNSRRRRQDPAERSKRQAVQRAYQAKVNADPDKVAARRQYRREYYHANHERARGWAHKYVDANRAKVRARWHDYDMRTGRKRGVFRERFQFAGSVVAAASPVSPGRDVLVTLLQMVPRSHDDTYREEVVATAALLHLEGATLEDAVKTATRRVRAQSRDLRYSVPIDDVAWI